MFRLFTTVLFILFANDAMAMKIGSKDFADGHNMHRHFTCEGMDISPEIHWSHVPDGTESLVLFMYDPDALRMPCGVVDHWVLFNLPPNLRSLPQGVKLFPEGTGFGRNSSGSMTYKGPCPPVGRHHYFVRLLALDTVLDLPNGASRTEVLEALIGHVIADVEIIGRYKSRQPRATRPRRAVGRQNSVKPSHS